jgi:hypothetical protein
MLTEELTLNAKKIIIKYLKINKHDT